MTRRSTTPSQRRTTSSARSGGDAPGLALAVEVVLAAASGALGLLGTVGGIGPRAQLAGVEAALHHVEQWTRGQNHLEAAGRGLVGRLEGTRGGREGGGTVRYRWGRG